MSGLGHNQPPIDGGGYIKVYRSMFDHWLVGRQNPDYFMAFCDLIAACAYSDGFIKTDNGRRLELRRGTLLGAISFLANRWNWSPKRVRTFIDKLEKEGMIFVTRPGAHQGRQRGTQSQVVTVCNYETYQGTSHTEGHAEGHASGIEKGTQGARKGHEEKKDKKDKKDNIHTGDGITRSVCLDCVEQYNSMASELGLPQARRLTPAREESLKVRLRQNGIESWQLALDNIRKSAFCQGRSESGWRIDFGKLLEHRIYARLIEGGYGNGAHGNSRPRQISRFGI